MPLPYVGGKQKYTKDLLSIILTGNEHRPYYEPFVGSAAMVLNVPSTMQRFANDKNPFLIALHQAVRDGWVPPTDVSEDEYNNIKRNPSQYPKELVAFVSIACSFGTKMWGGFARDPKGGTNFASRYSTTVSATAPFLSGVKFSSMDYRELPISNGALVYCDPPYAGTTDYGDYTIGGRGEFWSWCNGLVARDCQVFVSGYLADRTSGWETVWRKQVKASIDKKVSSSRNKRVECLFAPIQKHVNHLLAGEGIGACGCWRTEEEAAA